ncbi:calcium-binding protein [Pseudooceanicola sp. 502str34]
MTVSANVWPETEILTANSFAGEERDLSEPSVTALDGGGFVITWVSEDQDVTGPGLFGQVFDAQGQPVGAEFQVDTSMLSDQTNPSVASLAGGGFVVAWTSASHGGSDGDIFAQRFDDAGQRVGAEFQVSETTSGVVTSEPEVITFDDGSFFIGWSANVDAYNSSDAVAVMGRGYTANGVPVSAPIQLNETDGFDIESHSLLALDGQSFAVSWTSNTDGMARTLTRTFDSLGTVAGEEVVVSSVTRLDGDRYSTEYHDTETIRFEDGSYVVAWQVERTPPWTSSSPGNSSGNSTSYFYDSVVSRDGAVEDGPSIQGGEEGISVQYLSETGVQAFEQSTYYSNGLYEYISAGGVFDVSGLTSLRGDIAVFNQTGERNSQPTSTVLADGTIVVAWTSATVSSPYESTPDGPADIHYQLLRLNSAPEGTVFVTGNPFVGETLTASWQDMTDADGLGDLSVRWLRNGIAIEGATAATYELTQDDFGTQITAEVWFVDGTGVLESLGSDIITIGAVIEGTDGPDLLIGGGAADMLRGLGGDDTLQGNGGADVLYGGDGNDSIEASGVGSQLIGGEGADRLIGLTGYAMAFDGGAGNDTIQGAGVLDGNNGDDDITLNGGTAYGGAGADRITVNTGSGFGQSGDDLIVSPYGHGAFWGGDGNDTIQIGGDVANQVFGGNGDDLILAGGGHDTINPGEGSDTIYGGTASDIVEGNTSDLAGDFFADMDTLDAILLSDTQVFGAPQITQDADRTQLALDTTGDGSFDFQMFLNTAWPGLGLDAVRDGNDTMLYVRQRSGTTGNDLLPGNDFANIFEGLGGNDTLLGLGGDDILNGNDGDDSINGGLGNDTLSGGDGNDYILLGTGSDMAGGGAGNDTIQVGDTQDGDLNVIWAGSGDDRIIGGGYQDRIDGGDGNDTAYGRAGDDEITMGAGADVAFGEWGADTIRGGDGADSLHGGDDDDVLSGDNGADLLDGGNGNDYLDGGAGADTLNGGAGDDTIIGGQTETDLRDVIYAGDGNDSVDGGYGNDELRGDAGHDTLNGGFGADTAIGGIGDDVLTGAAWGDALFGGDGDDFLNGGFGFDRLNGGTGADRFYHLGNAGHGSDWVQDYNAAEGDLLVYGAEAQASDFLVQRATTANAGVGSVQEVFITHRPSGVLLWALVDGDAQAQLNVQAGGQVFDLLG